TAGGAWLLLRSAVHNAIDSTDRDRAVDVASSLAQRGPGAALDLVSEAEPSSGVDLVRIVAPDGSPMAARVTRGLQNVESLPVPRAGQVVEHDLVAPSGTDLRVTSVGVNVGGLTFGVDVGTDTERDDTMLTAGAVLLLARSVAPDGSPMAARVTRGLQNVESLPVPRAGQVVEHDLVAPSGTDLRVTSVGVNVGGLTFGVDVGTDTERYDTMLTAGAVLFLAFVPVAGLVTAVFVHLAMGRVLRPVESIRSRVAEISVSGRGERVPVPEAEDE